MVNESGLYRTTELLIREHIGYCEACGSVLCRSEWIVYRLSNHGPYMPSDIILLCPNCYIKVENGSISHNALIACTETRDRNLDSWLYNVILEDRLQRPVENQDIENDNTPLNDTAPHNISKTKHSHTSIWLGIIVLFSIIVILSVFASNNLGSFVHSLTNTATDFSDPIVGQWQYNVQMVGTIEYQFNADGTYQVNDASMATWTGTWTNSGNNVYKITISKSGVTSTMDAILQGNTLEIGSLSGNQMMAIYTLNKV